MYRLRYRYTLLFILISLLLQTSLMLKAMDHNSAEYVRFYDHKVPDLLHKYKTEGAAIVVIENGEIVLNKAYGMADKADGRFMDSTSVFQAASLSKPVTAIGVMKLVEEGLLDLDASVSQYLSRWQLPETTFNPDDVTVRSLLSHTAGLNIGGFRGYDPKDNLPTLVAALNGQNSSNNTPLMIKDKPGRGFSYSGGGYMLLSLLIEEVTQMRFEDYMKKTVFEPLGMIHSSFEVQPMLEQNLAVGYARNGVPFPDYRFAGKGAASLYTTAHDLAKLLLSIMSASKFNEPFLEARNVAEMLDPQFPLSGNLSLFFDEVALGFFKDATGMYAHSGSNRGWRNIMVFYPKQKNALVVLTNNDRGRNVYVDLLHVWCDRFGVQQPKIALFFNRMSDLVLGLSVFFYMLTFLFLAQGIKKIWIHRSHDLYCLSAYTLMRIFMLLLISIAGVFVIMMFFKIEPLIEDIVPLYIAGLGFALIFVFAAAVINISIPKLKKCDEH